MELVDRCLEQIPPNVGAKATGGHHCLISAREWVPAPSPEPMALLPGSSRRADRQRDAAVGGVRRRFILPQLSPARQPRYRWASIDAFTDGVYAIAATLLVLELHPPDLTGGSFGSALADQWPSYAFYIFGFLQIAGGWSALRRLRSWSPLIDHWALLLTLIVVLTFALVPFTVAVLVSAVEHHDGLTAAVRLMTVILLLSTVTYAGLFFYLDRQGFFRADLDPDALWTARLLSLSIPVWPLVALGLTFVVGPWSLVVVIGHFVLTLLPYDVMTSEQYAAAD